MKTAIFLNIVEDAMLRAKVIKSTHKILVALSGGADSVALLRALYMLGYQVEAVHCNFHLRGDESLRDENFVRHLCSAIHVPLHVRSFDTRAYARQHVMSIEMAARELRYTYFEQLRSELFAEVIAVAHHLDDNIETLLLNLVRGTGIHGLTGMKERNGFIVRPLLQVSRDDVLLFLQDIHQDYVTDSSNLIDDVVRNKIRLNVVPILQCLNPTWRDTMRNTLSYLQDAEDIYNHSISVTLARLVDDNFLNKHELEKEVAPETLLYEWLHPYGFNSKQVSCIYNERNGEPGAIYTAKRYRLLRDRYGWKLEEQSVTDAHLVYVLPKSGELRGFDGQLLQLSAKQIDASFSIPRMRNVACVDADKLQLPLSWRRVKNGDRFMPLGMKGMKLLSDFLTDLKKDRFCKQQQTVFCDADGRIVWLVNERPDERFRIDSSSQKACIIACR